MIGGFDGGNKLIIQTAGRRQIETLAKEFPCIDQRDFSNVIDEWKMYEDDDIPLSWYESNDETASRIDHYWSNVSTIRNPYGDRNYPFLTKVVTCALTLSHSNADTELPLCQQAYAGARQSVYN